MRNILLFVAASAGAATVASASSVQLRITVENLSPTNSITFAPLRAGFHDGTFDTFDEGSTATAPIISIAEGGSGADWFPAFASAQPNGIAVSVLPDPAGPLLPGQSGFADVTVDTAFNQFFSFGSMVVPSNDYFIGNDRPNQYRILYDSGNLLISAINQTASDIWDAGSEVDGPFGAAFLVGSNNDDRIADNGVVEFEFNGLSVFNGLTTAAGYVFDLQLAAETPVYRISFAVIPAPGVASIAALGGLAAFRRRRD
jgi:Spondin_N